MNEQHGLRQDLTRDRALLRAALEEKELLLREVHHRVKNNLQIISSLLNLPADAADPKLARVLMESQNRIQSIAFVHEQLINAASAGVINLGAYVQKLCAHLMHTYGAAERHIELRISAGQHYVDMDTGVSVSIILNELITNALTHAFPEGRWGTIQVRVEDDAYDYHLTVRDDGVGNDHVADGSATSVGWQLVEALVMQLAGRVERRSYEGTTVLVSVPKQAGRRREAEFATESAA
ncbi:MAG: sensor histidine kinase [Deltaproteobacteria bacterium]|nr:sensor histidine kinase [Deltaproteobacteria bacterium]